MGCATRSENQKEHKEKYNLQPLHKVFIFLAVMHYKTFHFILLPNVLPMKFVLILC
jgi:hypothetical protein